MDISSRARVYSWHRNYRWSGIYRAVHNSNQILDMGVKMNDMKCPFCQQELREIYYYGVVVGRLCPNPDCKKAEKLKGSVEFWQELIRTRKALDVAKYAIKNIKNDMKKVKDGDDIWEIQKNLHDYCKTTIKKITAIEQKD